MKKVIKIMFCGFLAIFTSSPIKVESEKQILENSGNIIAIMTVCQKIINAKVVDTSQVESLLTHIFDPRRSTDNVFTHRNPYFLRLLALEKVTGEKHNFSNYLDTEFDALVVDAYLDFAVRKGFILHKKDICLFQPPEYHEFGSKSVINEIRNSDCVDWLSEYYWPDRKKGVLHSK